MNRMEKLYKEKKISWVTLLKYYLTRMKIKSQKIHMLRWKTHGGFNPEGKKVRFQRLAYLCNSCVKPTPTKSTKNVWNVTCKNCIRIMIKGSD
jgi:hypothetical protein